ncbi:hypothetical protein EON68_02720 [archaeon]|nr:MAG: hypothetical protein EON68_02720 [archaeon]
MASDIATAKADLSAQADDDRPRRIRRFGGSRLGGLILALNLVSLLILFVGALLLNEWSRGLITARQETLTAQGELLVRVLGDERIGVTTGDPMPSLDPIEASRWLRDNFILPGQRARLFDIDGLLVADSYAVTEVIPGEALPPASPAGTPPPRSDAKAQRVARRRANPRVHCACTPAARSVHVRE